MPDPSDELLLRRVAGGDAAAFEVIYDRHSAAAYARAVRICRDRAVAEEVMQEAFLTVWRSAASFDPSRGRARPWILGIVTHRAIDALRRQRRHLERTAADALEDTFEAPVRTDREVLRREQGDLVRAGLARLPAGQRDVIVLAHFAGLTHTEIAALLGYPVGTVKGRMRLGLVKLRAFLESRDLTESLEMGCRAA